MSHEFESGFFTRQAAWHGLGNVLEHAPSHHTEALRHAELDWQVEKHQLLFKAGTPDLPTIAHDHKTDLFAIVRDSDMSVLGYGKKEYQPLQNADAMKWCQPLVDTELWRFETAGSLKNGQYCWALLKQDETEIVPNDVLGQYLLFMWSHTGKASNIVKPASVRVVCNNTLECALQDGQNAHRVRHSCTMPQKLDDIQSLYKRMSLEFAQQHELFDQMVNTHWTDTILEEYVDTISPALPREAGKVSSKVTRSERQNATLKEMVVAGKATGAMDLGIKNTAYGAYQAASEFHEHYMGGGHVADRGLWILNGKGAKANRNALGVAIDMAGISN